MIKYQYLCDTDIIYLRECILMQRVRRIVFLIAYMCLVGMVCKMPVHVAKSQGQETGREVNSVEYPEMTADEHFLIFGSSGGIGCDGELYDYDTVVRALTRIRGIEVEDVLTGKDKMDDAKGESVAEEFEIERQGTSVVSMTTGTVGINLIKKWEGLRLTAYKALSTEENYTIGYGHHGSDVKEGMTITEAQAEALLLNDVKKFESSLNTYCRNNKIALNQNQFDASTSVSMSLTCQKDSRYSSGMCSRTAIRKYVLNTRCLLSSFR